MSFKTTLPFMISGKNLCVYFCCLPCVVLAALNNPNREVHTVCVKVNWRLGRPAHGKGYVKSFARGSEVFTVQFAVCGELYMAGNLLKNAFTYFGTIVIRHISFIIISSGPQNCLFCVGAVIFWSPVGKCNSFKREAHPSSRPFIHSSMVLQLFVGPWPLFQLRDPMYHR
jgi:hypothetical protein